MKKFTFLVLIIISTYQVRSQSVSVSYKVSAENIFNTSRPDTLPDIVQKTFRNAERNFKNVQYKLDITNNESHFEMEDKLINDGDNKARLTIALSGFSGKIYCNKKENIKIRQSDVYGQTFLISSTFDDLEWTITKETKNINGFKTYKAIASENYETGKSSETWEIVAWFAPELTHSFGPGGYGGLPGLILELHRGGKIYKMNKYENVENSLAIQKPEEGKKVTQEEFDKIGRETAF